MKTIRVEIDEEHRRIKRREKIQSQKNKTNTSKNDHSKKDIENPKTNKRIQKTFYLNRVEDRKNETVLKIIETIGGNR